MLICSYDHIFKTTVWAVQGFIMGAAVSDSMLQCTSCSRKCVITQWAQNGPAANVLMLKPSVEENIPRPCLPRALGDNRALHNLHWLQNSAKHCLRFTAICYNSMECNFGLNKLSFKFGKDAGHCHIVLNQYFPNKRSQLAEHLGEDSKQRPTERLIVEQIFETDNCQKHWNS